MTNNTIGVKYSTENALPSIDLLISNREVFNSFIYTPLEEALAELDKRRNDESIQVDIKAPLALQGEAKAVMFRQLVTPNYEIRRFLSLLDSIKLKPLFWEYHNDKFTSNNEWKHSLGRLFFYHGRGKQGGAKIDSKNAIDFNLANGRKISEVKTITGESLIDFHHHLFSRRFPDLDLEFFDASEWFHHNGEVAKDYYKSFLALFVKDAILFENFMLDEKELSFTRDIFLPAFIEVYRSTGLKPLIVSLEPTDIEGDRFWICHPHEDKEYILNRLGIQEAE